MITAGDPPATNAPPAPGGGPARAPVADQRFAQVARGLAHELRNPLSTMKMNLQLVVEDWRDALGDKAQRLRNRLGTVLGEVQRLEETLQTFVDYAGSVEYHFAPVHMGGLLEGVLYFLAPEFEKTKVRVSKVYDPALDAIPADQNRLKQALLNVLLNAQAAVAAQGGGEIWVRTRRAGDWAEIEILDSGPGMSAEQRARIFDAYYSTKPRGTGLGLPICQRIVAAHGGSIEVESERGQGTLVRLRLPAVRVADDTGEGAS